jgi:hypothetical protein
MIFWYPISENRPTLVKIQGTKNPTRKLGYYSLKLVTALGDV